MFKKGNSGNPTGRPPGAKNQTNTEIRQAFQELVEGNLSNIENWLDEVAAKDPAKALDFLLKLSEYIVPKLKAIELSKGFDTDIIVIPPAFSEAQYQERLDKAKKVIGL